MNPPISAWLLDFVIESVENGVQRDDPEFVLDAESALRVLKRYLFQSADEAPGAALALVLYGLDLREIVVTKTAEERKALLREVVARLQTVKDDYFK